MRSQAPRAFRHVLGTGAMSEAASAATAIRGSINSPRANVLPTIAAATTTITANAGMPGGSPTKIEQVHATSSAKINDGTIHRPRRCTTDTARFALVVVVTTAANKSLPFHN